RGDRRAATPSTPGSLRWRRRTFAQRRGLPLVELVERGVLIVRALPVVDQPAAARGQASLPAPDRLDAADFRGRTASRPRASARSRLAETCTTTPRRFYSAPFLSRSSSTCFSR